MQLINLNKHPAEIRGYEIVGELTPVNVNSSDGGQEQQPQPWPEKIKEITKDLPPEVTSKEKRQLMDLLMEYPDVFSQDETDVGYNDMASNQIDTGDIKPIRQQLRRQPPAYHRTINEQVELLLPQGVIEKAQGTWAANVVLVKKDNAARFCIDYHTVNQHTFENAREVKEIFLTYLLTVADSYPLSRIDVFLDSLAGA